MSTSESHLVCHAGTPGHPSVITAMPEGMVSLYGDDVDLHSKDPLLVVNEPHRGRIPLDYDAQGYFEVLARTQIRTDSSGRPVPPTRSNIEAIGNKSTIQVIEDEGSQTDGFDAGVGMDRQLPVDIKPEDVITSRYTISGGPATLSSESRDLDSSALSDTFSDGSEMMSVSMFNALSQLFKDQQGQFRAITAYGCVPVPQEILHDIPEKFVAKPIVEEREIFVYKQDVVSRTADKNFVQFEHSFDPVRKVIEADRFKAVEDLKEVEVPRFIYKPVIEDKIVEIPQGIKYVEVPIEIECVPPPKIVPVPKEHIVERIIETTKPVNQYKIIEIPRIIKEKVAKVMTKEIPYVVPKYVEKIIEVPYRPDMSHLPAPHGSPMLYIPQPPPLPPAPLPPGLLAHQIPGYQPPTDQPNNPVSANTANIPLETLNLLMLKAGIVPGGQRPPLHPAQQPGVPPPTSGAHSGLPSGSRSPRSYSGGGIPEGTADPMNFPLIPVPYYPQQDPETRVVHGMANLAKPTATVNSSKKVVVSGPTVTLPKIDDLQTLYASPGITEIKLPYEAKIDISMVQLDEVPAGVSIAQPGVRFEAPSAVRHIQTPRSARTSRPEAQSGAKGLFSSCCPEPPTRDPDVVRPLDAILKDEDSSDQFKWKGFKAEPTPEGIPAAVYAGPMDPIVVHDNPGMGQIDFRSEKQAADILTQMGIKKFPWYVSKYDHNADFLVPPLPAHPMVPMNPPGIPDFRTLEAISTTVARESDMLPPFVSSEMPYSSTRDGRVRRLAYVSGQDVNSINAAVDVKTHAITSMLMNPSDTAPQNSSDEGMVTPPPSEANPAANGGNY